MGKRGPAKKPTKLKLLSGNPGRRPLPEAEPEAVGAPVEPDFLDDYGLAVWRRIVDGMPEGVYAAADSDLIAAYALAAQLHREAAQKIRKEGLTTAGAQGGMVVHPAVRVQKVQVDAMRSIGTRLGLDPAARQDINTNPGEEKNPFAALSGLSA